MFYVIYLQATSTRSLRVRAHNFIIMRPKDSRNCVCRVHYEASAPLRTARSILCLFAKRLF